MFGKKARVHSPIPRPMTAAIRTLAQRQVFGLQGREIRRGDNVGQRLLKEGDLTVGHLTAEGVAERSGIQHEGDMKVIRLEAQLLQGLLARQLVGRKEIGAA